MLWPSWIVLLVTAAVEGGDNDYNVLHRDGSYQFGYDTPDSYHYADANRNNVVRGQFGGRNPGTGAIDNTIYTAGPRGYRPRGKNVVRKYDLNQSGPRAIGSRDDPYYDPYEDPSYHFSFKTRTYTRTEDANRVGDVKGKYSYLDDVGERHNVEFIAGKNTGFHVKTPFPDSNPRAYGPLYFRGRGRPIPRGRTSIQRGLDGSYRFVSAGPDQRRTEVSDASGHVRGSYTYLDDKGVQHAVHYIAGPETGYRVIKNVKGPHLPTVFPFGRPDIIPPDFYDDYGKDVADVFDTAATGRFKPVDNSIGSDKGGNKEDIPSFDSGVDIDKDEFDKFEGNLKPGGRKPNQGRRPTYDNDGGSDDFGDLFGGGNKPSGSGEGGGGAIPSSEENGSYGKPSEEDGGYFSGEDTSSTTSRPASSTGASGGPYPPTRRPTTYRPQKPKPPKQPRPSFDDDYSNAGDYGIFGDESESKPPFGSSTPGTSTYRPGTSTFYPAPSPSYGPPTSAEDGIHQIGIGASPDCTKCDGTLVTNLGDRVLSVPPGVSVRAHVQAIDLLPLSSKVPSPSEQLRAEMSELLDTLGEASNDFGNNSTSISVEKHEKSPLNAEERQRASRSKEKPFRTKEFK